MFRDNLTVRTFVVAMLLLYGYGATSVSAQCPFVPDGYFAFAGPAPKGFENVAFVALWDYRRKRGTEMRSGVYSTDAQYFGVETMTIDTGPNGLGFIWKFRTSATARVRYTFDGKFRSVCDFADPHEGALGRVLLAGHLERLEDDVTVASAETQFAYYAKLPKRLKRYRLTTKPGAPPPN